MKRIASILVPFLDLELITHWYGEETTCNLWNLNMSKGECYWTSCSATWIHRVSSNMLMAKSVLIIFRLGVGLHEVCSRQVFRLKILYVYLICSLFVTCHSHTD